MVPTVTISGNTISVTADQDLSPGQEKTIFTSRNNTTVSVTATNTGTTSIIIEGTEDILFPGDTITAILTRREIEIRNLNNEMMGSVHYTLVYQLPTSSSTPPGPPGPPRR